MRFLGLNTTGIIAGAVAAWAFGAIWYYAFGARWADALGTTKNQLMSDSRRPIAVLALSFAAMLVMAAILARLIADMGPDSIVAGLFTAAMCWLGFVVTAIAVNNSYARNSIALTVVSSWHWLGVLLVMGAVIGAFG